MIQREIGKQKRRDIRNKENLIFSETDEERKKIVGQDRPFAELPLRYEYHLLVQMIT